jgi:hypothetical protein
VSEDNKRAAHRAARRIIVAAAIAAALGRVAAVPAAAHGELVFQVGAERIQPGGTVEVRGDLGTGSTIDIVLISKIDGTRRPVATLTNVDEGHFQDFVTIPADVATGDYVVEAGTESIAARAPLTVAGSAVAEGGDGPDRGDGLLAPMPSGWSGYSPASPATGVRSGPAVAITGDIEGWPLPPLSIAVIVVIAVVGLLGGLRLATRARPSTR